MKHRHLNTKLIALTPNVDDFAGLGQWSDGSRNPRLGSSGRTDQAYPYDLRVIQVPHES
jgi:hypothetical protein